MSWIDYYELDEFYDMASRGFSIRDEMEGRAHYDEEDEIDEAIMSQEDYLDVSFAVEHSDEFPDTESTEWWTNLMSRDNGNLS